MFGKFHRSPDKLPQLAESWYVAIPKLRVWIAPPNEDPWQPYAVIVLNLDTGKLNKVEAASAPPDPEQLMKILLDVMQKPSKETGQKPHRPQQILIAEAALANALAPKLDKIGVKTGHEPHLEGIDELVQELEDHLRGGPEHPGLLSVKGVTPELAGGLFAAAAEFYRAAPWVSLTDQHTLAIKVTPEKQPRFVQVMGNGGVEYGLAMYKKWADVERIYSFADNPLEVLPASGGHSFFFDAIDHLPFADLEAIEKYGWEVADKRAYPTPLIYNRNGQVNRPGQADLRWYEAALWAIPRFVDEFLKSGPAGDYVPVEATFPVPTHAGETIVHIKYPGGVLSKELHPAKMTDWSEFWDKGEEDELPPFDRRAMEGTMAQLGAQVGGTKLNKAQELMYQAWEEPNPARRIILAHDALNISPDCADAYVLLAEEEADTLGRALEYYHQGVAAGERSLGKKFFKENVGHFWGLLESRPYMRARQGLANTLWELNRGAEAVMHYRDMLRLNPGDNQGIRYSLLNLLLTLNHEAEAQALLKEYEDDGMAEWLYTRALLTFRAKGPGPEAETALREAMSQNAHVPAYLTGGKRIPVRLPPYLTWGGEDEAILYASSYLAHWRRTPGALDWLQAHLKTASTSPAKSTRTDRKRGKRHSSRR
jgi:tetratricopeptide (TPR) repeat protein